MLPVILRIRPPIACPAFRAFSSSRPAHARVQRTDVTPKTGGPLASEMQEWLENEGVDGGEAVETSDLSGDVKVKGWEPQPIYLPLTSVITRKSGEMRPSRKVIELDPTIFSHPIRRDILYLCVQYHLDGLRQGSASTKTRAEVNGSGHKLRPQKGSGKARLGDRGSPMLRGGGVAHGPKPRDFSTSLPKKVLAMGMRIALTSKLREKAFGVVESLDWQGTKTGELRRQIATKGWRKVLLVTGADEVPLNLERCSRNLQHIACAAAKNVAVYDLLRWPTVVMDTAAVDYFQEEYTKQSGGSEVDEEASTPVLETRSAAVSADAQDS